MTVSYEPTDDIPANEFELNCTVSPGGVKQTVNVRVSGYVTVLAALQALHVIGQTEYLAQIAVSFNSDNDWEDEDEE